MRVPYGAPYSYCELKLGAPTKLQRKAVRQVISSLVEWQAHFLCGREFFGNLPGQSVAFNKLLTVAE